MLGIDIDGTMLRADGRLSARVKRALHDARDAGMAVVPATGRPLLITHEVIEAVELPHYWVFANGAVTRHLGRGELVRGFWMDDDTTRSLIGLVRAALPAAGFAVEFEETVTWEPGFEHVVPIVPDADPIDDVLGSIGRPGEGAGPNGRIQKILIFDLTIDLDSLYDRITDAAGDRAMASYSGLAFVELAAGRVTKATALQLLAADLGIDRVDVACFGDNHNDLAMLEWAGRGYAMGNATDDAKATANEVILDNERDGLAVKVEELLRLDRPADS